MHTFMSIVRALLGTWPHAGYRLYNMVEGNKEEKRKMTLVLPGVENQVEI